MSIQISQSESTRIDLSLSSLHTGKTVPLSKLLHAQTFQTAGIRQAFQPDDTGFFDTLRSQHQAFGLKDRTLVEELCNAASNLSIGFVPMSPEVSKSNAIKDVTAVIEILSDSMGDNVEIPISIVLTFPDQWIIINGKDNTVVLDGCCDLNYNCLPSPKTQMRIDPPTPRFTPQEASPPPTATGASTFSSSRSIKSPDSTPAKDLKRTTTTSDAPRERSLADKLFEIRFSHTQLAFDATEVLQRLHSSSPSGRSPILHESLKAIHNLYKIGPEEKPNDIAILRPVSEILQSRGGGSNSNMSDQIAQKAANHFNVTVAVINFKHISLYYPKLSQMR